jgi:hypothetical protein
MQGVKTFFAQNVDTKIVVSAALGLAVMGVVIYAATRSGLKPLQQAAKVAAGGK